MGKTLFSFHLDDALKNAAQEKATKENRSLGNLVETAIRFYLNPEPIGARVTVKTTEATLPKNSPFGKFTARIKSIDPDNDVMILEEKDPVTGKDHFKIKDILSVHLM